MSETPDIPTDTPTKAEAVERAARALYAHRFSEWVQRNKLPEFTELAEREQEAFRFEAIAAIEAIGHDALVRERDQLRLALSRGWTLGQYEYAEANDEWGTVAGDGSPQPWIDAPSDPSVTPGCPIHGTTLRLVIDMGRVQAGVGGPRPTYVCDQCAADPEQDYCGCCGEEIYVDPNEATIPLWCDRCWHHTGLVGPPWERTYESLNGEPCPFQVGATPKEQTQ